MTLYSILIGKEQNNCLNLRNSKLIKIYLVSSNKKDIELRLKSRNQNSEEEIKKKD